MANTSSTTAPIAASLYANLQNLPEKEKFVYDASEGYSTLSYLADWMSKNSGGAKKINEYRWSTFKRANTGVSTMITAAPVAAGTNLVVTITPSATMTTDLFRTDWIVKDVNNVQGRVVSRTANTITLSPHSVTTWNTATHFQPTVSNISVLFNASRLSRSVGTETMYNNPTEDFGVIGVTRDSGTLAWTDQIQSYPYYEKNGFWWTGWDTEVVKRFARERENKILYSARVERKNSATGEYSTTGGLDWTIKNNGGTLFPLNAPLTQTDLNDAITTMLRKQANTNHRRLVGFMGAHSFDNIQSNITNQYVLQAGDRNTFGGQTVMGIDTKTYSFNNTTIDFVHLPIMDDEVINGEISTITGTPRESNSIYLMDTSPLPAINDQGFLPMIERKYHKQEFTAGYLHGIGAESDIMHVGEAIQNTNMVTDVAGSTFHIFSEEGWYIRPERCAKIELAS